MQALFKARKSGCTPADILAARKLLMRKHRHGYIGRLDESRAQRLAESVAGLDALAEARRRASMALDQVIWQAQSRWPELVRGFAVPKTTVLWRFTFLVAQDRRKALIQILRRRGLQVSQLFAPMHRQYLEPDDDFPIAPPLTAVRPRSRRMPCR